MVPIIAGDEIEYLDGGKRVKVTVNAVSADLSVFNVVGGLAHYRNNPTMQIVIIKAAEGPRPRLLPKGTKILLKNLPILNNISGKIVTLDHPIFSTFGYIGSISVNNGKFAIMGSDILREATPEDIVAEEEAEAKKEAERAEKYKMYVFSADKIEAIANHIFGEDRVEVLNRTSEGKIITTIHFPEVTIRNSRAVNAPSHLIRDMYLRYTISNINPDSSVKFTTSFRGARSTWTNKEYYSNYGHSHMGSGVGVAADGEFNHMCTGASSFVNINTNLAMEPTKENWALFFRFLNTYVSWESLAGGPYNHFSHVGSSADSSFYIPDIPLREDLVKYIDKLPVEYWDFADNTFSLNPNSEVLAEFFSRNTKLDANKFRANYGNSQFNLNDLPAMEKHLRERGYGKFTFKGKNIEKKIILDEDGIKKSEIIDQELMTALCVYINKKVSIFTNKYSYDKIKRKSTLFTSGKVLKQA